VNEVAGLVLRSRLFVSSFAPLFVIFAIRFQDRGLQLACAGLAAFGIATLILLLRAARRIEPDPHRIETVADRGAEVAGYVATYLLPFVTVTEPSTRDVVAYLTFVLVIGVVYVRSEMIQINPVLYLLGYRVWKITTSEGWSGYFIGRDRPRAGAALLASRLANTVAVEKRRDDKVASRPGGDPR
jgi:hypothetical protein